MGQSLEEAIRITLRTNPDIQASAYSVTAAEQLKNQVRGSLLPSVDFVFFRWPRGVEQYDHASARGKWARHDAG